MVLPLSLRINGTSPAYSLIYFSARPMWKTMSEKPPSLANRSWYTWVTGVGLLYPVHGQRSDGIDNGSI